MWQQGIQRLVFSRFFIFTEISVQSGLGITKCGRVDYKVHQRLESEAGLQSELVHHPSITK